MASYIAGCAVQKTWTPTGGSRSGGNVDLSYEYGLFQSPQVNNQQGVNAAKSKCIAWGYTDAEAFGGSMRKCSNYGPDGCNRWLVTASYQCIGEPKARENSSNTVAKESIYTELSQLKELLDKKILSEEEYLIQKSKILDKY
tara:strand:- start:532 stop:957 length:426 start_codon:yes stop_codon:yes gene_type:complete